MSENEDRNSINSLNIWKIEQEEELSPNKKKNKIRNLERKIKSKTILSFFLIFALSLTLSYIFFKDYIQKNQNSLKNDNIKKDYNSKEYNAYKDYIEALKSENKDLRKKVKFLEAKINGEKTPLFKGIESNINVNFEQIVSYLPHYPTKITRIFSAKKNGHSSQNFHRLCDNQGATLVLIKSSKGYTFGGYTEQSWVGEGWKRDPNAFLFSLDRKVKTLSQDEHSIYTSPQYGPKFGYSSIVVSNNCFDNELSSTAVETSYGRIQLQEKSQFKTNEYFKVEDYEVFKVDYKEEQQISETWAEDGIKDLEDFIEEQGIYIRQ